MMVMHVSPRCAPVLRGRGREQQAVTDLLTRAAAGHGGALLLQGELGLGKTTLLGYADAAAAAGGFTVLATAGLADEAALPYAALQRLLQPILDRLPDLPAGQARMLARALAGDGTPGGGEAGLARFTAVRGLLGTAARSRPVLCCVDDADQLDPCSREAIAFAARRLSGHRVALLATTAGTGTGSGGSGGRALAGVPTLRLAPLDAAAARTLLADLLPEPLPEPVASALVGLAGGNPQALAELAHCLTPAQRAGTAPPPASLPAGSALRRAYQDQLQQLPAPAQRLLLVAAAAAGPDVSGPTGTATGAQPPAPGLAAGCLVRAAQRCGVDIAVLAPAERAGLVRTTDAGVSFPQPLVRAIVYEGASLAQRREADLILGEAAAAAGDYGRAAAATARAAELTCAPAEAARRLVTAARYAWLSGSPDQARRLLRQARPAAGAAGAGSGEGAGSGAVAAVAAEAEVEGERRLLTGEIELRTGAAATALLPLLSAAATLAGHRRDLAGRALLRAAEAAWFSGDHTHDGEIAAQVAALRYADDPPAEQQLLECAAGVTATALGRPRPAASCLRRVLALVDQLDAVVPLVLASWASLLLADYPGGYRLACRAVESARDTGHAAALPVALELRADTEFALGRYDAAGTSCREGLRAARASGQRSYAADHVAMLSVLAAIRGDREGSRRWLRELVVPAGAGPLCRPVALSQWALAVGDLTAGRPQDAAGRLAAIGDPATGHGQVAIQLMAAPWLVEAAARAGQQQPVAAAVLGLFERWADRTHAALLTALAARCRALLAPRGSAAALEHFHEALRLHPEGECDFELARTELLFGQELRRRRRPRDARGHLHRALETFRQLALGGWAEQAATELRAAGQRIEHRPVPPPAPSRGTGGAVGLTAQQRQIARLVAGGSTNREVAAQLFISPRTVDHHLRNIFHRLGIRSRVELARLVS